MQDAVFEHAVMQASKEEAETMLKSPPARSA